MCSFDLQLENSPSSGLTLHGRERTLAKRFFMMTVPTNKPRHVPQRTCLACGRKTAKAELLRLCRNRDGQVLIDLRQCLPGRGAYVCPSAACTRLLLKKKSLQHGLRAPVSQEDYTKILEFVQNYAAPRIN